MQHELILTKVVNGITFILKHVPGSLGGNLFQLTATEGQFTNGRGATYSDGTPINQAKVEGKSILITKAEIERLGTYKTYHNGLDIVDIIFGKWQDAKGRTLIFSRVNDFYYYFRRPDCGIVQVNNNKGVHVFTDFHNKYGERDLTILEK